MLRGDRNESGSIQWKPTFRWKYCGDYKSRLERIREVRKSEVNSADGVVIPLPHFFSSAFTSFFNSLISSLALSPLVALRNS
jgi:hypothetical protein